MPYQGYDPSKYMKDFSWIGDIGNTIAQFAYKMPELIELNKSIAENTEHNRDTYKGIQNFISAMISHPKLYEEISQNYDVDSPEELKVLLSQKFRAPKEREDNGAYTNEITKSMSEILRENAGIDPSLFATLAMHAEEGAVTPDIFAIHDKQKNIHAFNKFMDMYKSGNKKVDDMGNEAVEPYSYQEAIQLLNQFGLSANTPGLEPILKDAYQSGKIKEFEEELKKIDNISTASFTEVATKLSAKFPNMTEHVMRNKFRDEQVARWVQEDKERSNIKKEEIANRAIRAAEGNKEKAIQFIERQRNVLSDDIKDLLEINEPTAEQKTMLKRLQLRDKVYEQSIIAIDSGQYKTDTGVDTGQALVGEYKKILQQEKTRLLSEWASGEFRGFKLFNPATYGLSDDKKRLKEEAESIGLTVKFEKNKQTGKEDVYIGLPEINSLRETQPIQRQESEQVTKAHQKIAQLKQMIDKYQSNTMKPDDKNRLEQIAKSAGMSVVDWIQSEWNKALEVIPE